MNPELFLYNKFESDREKISLLFFTGEDPGEIVSAAGIGDRHLHGESVKRIETSRGFTFYFKPRDCRSTQLLGDLTELLFCERMVPEQITGDGYAFQKAIETKLPETDAEKAGYYEKLGKLMALFYALGSTDMHNGNIICAGNLPVVIDTETLLCAKAEGIGGAGEFSVDYGEIFPAYRTSAGECMVLPRFYGYTQTTPLIPAVSCRPEGYEQVFITGFQDGYRMICERKEDMLRLMQSYADAPFRYLLRSTRYYAIKILQYRNAKDADAQKRVMKGIEKGLSESDLKRWAPVLAWERACICEGDVPYFWFRAAGCDLYGDVNADPLIPEFLELSPVRYAGWRISRMCEPDMAVQTAYIRASLKHIDGWEKPEPMPDTAAENNQTPLSVAEAVHEAEKTLRRLWEERIPLPDGSCLWHMPFIKGKPGCLFALAEGFAGIAVFVHDCARSSLITGEAAGFAQDLASACFRDLAVFGEYLLKTYPEPPEERILSRRFNGGFDFKDGISGFLWAIKHCRDEDPQRADRILEGFNSWPLEHPDRDDRDILKRITLEPASENGTDCLEGGAAGDAASLLPDAEMEGFEEQTKKAGVILKKIVDRKKETGCYQVFRKGRQSYFLAAFLRGDTGIAYVLLRYAERSDRLPLLAKSLSNKMNNILSERQEY